MTILMWMTGIGVVALLLARLPAIIESIWPDSDFMDAYRYGDFMDGAKMAGMDYGQSRDEIRIREAIAALRRKASDAVIANPVGWYGILKAETKAAIEDLAGTYPDLIPVFAERLKGLPYDHILYEDAVAAVDRVMGLAVDHRRPGPDARAALKIVKR